MSTDSVSLGRLIVGLRLAVLVAALVAVVLVFRMQTADPCEGDPACNALVTPAAWDDELR